MLFVFLNPIYNMDQENTEYVEVLFVTLSLGNGSPHQLLWKKASKFLIHLSRFTKTHINAVRGFNRGANSHEHLIVLVPRDEVDRFKKKLSSFKSYKAWSWIHEVSPFKPELKEKAYTYTLVKHEPVQVADGRSFYCPRYYNRCRGGLCSHYAPIHWQQQVDQSFPA